MGRHSVVTHPVAGHPMVGANLTQRRCHGPASGSGLGKRTALGKATSRRRVDRVGRVALQFHAILQAVYQMTEPVYDFVRKKMPFVVLSGIDLSPIVILLTLQFIDSFMMRSFFG